VGEEDDVEEDGIEEESNKEEELVSNQDKDHSVM